MNRIAIITALTISISMLGCITEKPKGYNEPGYPASYFEHPKLGWCLNKTYYIYETQGIDAARSFIASNPNNIVEGDSIGLRIIIKERNQTNLNVLESLGTNVTITSPTNDPLIFTQRTVRINETFISPDDNELSGVFVPIPKIRDLGELEFIDSIYPDRKPVPN